MKHLYFKVVLKSYVDMTIELYMVQRRLHFGLVYLNGIILRLTLVDEKFEMF